MIKFQQCQALISHFESFWTHSARSRTPDLYRTPMTPQKIQILLVEALLNINIFPLQPTCGYKTNSDCNWFNNFAIHVWITFEKNARVAEKEMGSTNQFQE